MMIVPGTGLEPVNPCESGGLSPLRLPIPPSGRELVQRYRPDSSPYAPQLRPPESEAGPLAVGLAARRSDQNGYRSAASPHPRPRGALCPA